MATGDKILLTAKRVADFSCDPSKAAAFLWDTDAKGLGLKASPGGSKQFILESRLKSGKSVRLTIGKPSTWAIGDARIEARRLQALIDQGTDPREIRKKQEEAKAAEKAASEAARTKAEEKRKYTFHALCDAYCNHLERNGKTKSAAAARSAFKCHVLNKSSGKIAEMPANEVTTLQIASMIRIVHESGKERTAGVLRSYLSAAFNAAKRAPFDTTLSADLVPFGIEHNPVDAIPAFSVKAGNRALSNEELKLYLSNLGEDLADKALLLALLCGGQRMAQLLRAKVSDFDQEATILRLWDGKGKRKAPREHLLPLGPKATELVQVLITAIKTREEVRNHKTVTALDLQDQWLFSTHGRVAMAFTTPGKRVAELSAKLGGEAFDLRDIRRTCETMLAKIGVSKDLRAQLLSHGLSGVQDAHYDRHDYLDEKRKALFAWEVYLTKIHPIRTGDETRQPKMSDLFKEKQSRRKLVV